MRLLQEGSPLVESISKYFFISSKNRSTWLISQAISRSKKPVLASEKPTLKTASEEASTYSKKIFFLDDIDLFAYANSENSYTATRSVATYLKGVTVALDKPLIAVLAEEHEGFHADKILMSAKQQFENSGFNPKAFDPNDANPVYAIDTQYKKINE